jgi:biopolymer transport protein ExbB/TolQ
MILYRIIFLWNIDLSFMRSAYWRSSQAKSPFAGISMTFYMTADGMIVGSASPAIIIVSVILHKFNKLLMQIEQFRIILLL